MQTGIFSEYMAKLLKHSLMLDGDLQTHSSFVELQQLEARIINARTAGYFTGREAMALSAIADGLHRDYRKALKLDNVS